jgi:hypothetical protein
MTSNNPGGFQNLMSGAQNLLGSGQTQQPQTGGGLLSGAQNLLGSGQTQPTTGGGIHKKIDTAQAFMGHTGQGGAGVHGMIDKGQSLMGHQGPTGAQGLLNQGIGLLSGQQSGQGSGTSGIMNLGQGLLGNQGQGQKVPTQGSNINSTIDTAQRFMGHTGQGGTGVQGLVDKAQGFIGQGQTGVQGSGIQSSAQGLLGNQNVGQQRAPQNLTEQAGQGKGGIIGKVQGLFGHGDQAGMH